MPRIDPVQLRTRLAPGAAGPPTPAEITNSGADPRLVGEPFYNDADLGLYVDTGVNVRTVVSPLRQVELTGDQAITGLKTFDYNGGAANATVELHSATLALLRLFSGPTATPDYDWVVGSNPTGYFVINDRVHAMGQPRFRIDDAGAVHISNLLTIGPTNGFDTTAQDVRGAINELYNDMGNLSAGMEIVGTFDPENNLVTPDTGSPGPLPVPADPGNKGWVFIVSPGGTGAGITNAPHFNGILFNAGDWVQSNGTTWSRRAIGAGAVIAGNVSIAAIPGITGTTTVQGALERVLPLTGGTATGPVNINTSGTALTAASGALLHIAANPADPARIFVEAFGGNPGIFFRKANGIPGALTAVTPAQNLGMITAWGHDGNAYSGNAITLAMVPSQNWTTTAHGTEFIFNTTEIDSVGVPINAMRIRSGVMVGAVSATPGAQGDMGYGTLNCAVGIYVDGDPVMVAGDGVNGGTW